MHTHYDAGCGHSQQESTCQVTLHCITACLSDGQTVFHALISMCKQQDKDTLSLEVKAIGLARFYSSPTPPSTKTNSTSNPLLRHTHLQGRRDDIPLLV